MVNHYHRETDHPVPRQIADLTPLGLSPRFPQRSNGVTYSSITQMTGASPATPPPLSP